MSKLIGISNSCSNATTREYGATNPAIEWEEKDASCYTSQIAEAHTHAANTRRFQMEIEENVEKTQVDNSGEVIQVHSDEEPEVGPEEFNDNITTTKYPNGRNSSPSRPHL